MREREKEECEDDISAKFIYQEKSTVTIWSLLLICAVITSCARRTQEHKQERVLESLYKACDGQNV